MAFLDGYSADVLTIAGPENCKGLGINVCQLSMSDKPQKYKNSRAISNHF